MDDRTTGIAVTAAAMPMPLAVLAAIALGHAPTAPRAPYALFEDVPAAIGAAPAPTAAPTPVRYARSDLRCLARAVWNEARGEPREGQIAVAEVVVARSRDRRWKGSLCHAIELPNQFSFVRHGRTEPIPDPDAVQPMMDLARGVAAGRLRSRVRGALYYHATYVHPVWRHGLRVVARLRLHVFYADPRRPSA